VRGAAGAIGWQFGVALAQAGEVACRAVAKGGRSAALRLLGQALEPLSEDLGHVLLLAAMRRITMDEAAMLLSLPPAEANARVVTAMLAAHRD
jgi:DNA-directed RNA polymerase specialized sigma24 family protein